MSAGEPEIAVDAVGMDCIVSVVKKQENAEPCRYWAAENLPSCARSALMGKALLSNRHAIHADLAICGQHIAALLGAGAAISCISRKLLKKLAKKKLCVVEPASLGVFSCDSASARLAEKTAAWVGSGDVKVKQEAHAADRLPLSLLLGCDFLPDTRALLGFCKREVCFFTSTSAASCPLRPQSSMQKQDPESSHGASLSPKENFLKRASKRRRRSRKLESRRYWAAAVKEGNIIAPMTQRWISCCMPADKLGARSIFQPHFAAEETLPASQYFKRSPKAADILVANISTEPILAHENQLLGKVESLSPKVECINAMMVSDGSKVDIKFGSEIDQHHLEAPPNPPELDARVGKDTKLNLEQVARLKQLLSKFADIISTAADPGRAALTKLKIDAGDARPMRKPPYRNVRDVGFIDEWADEKMKLDLIGHSTSEWRFPLAAARQPSKKPRACVDYRDLSEVAKAGACVLPRQDDTIDSLQGAKIFSALGLARGFHQLAIDKKSREKTAFATRRGLLEWKRLPLGLKNGPAAFQRLMQAILQKLRWKRCLLCLDDIIIYSSSLEDHLKHLEQAFLLLRQSGLRLRSEKCRFAASSINYLGHIISEEGARIDPRKAAAIADFARPRSVGQLKRLLGAANYHRRFAKYYSELALPLTSLLLTPPACKGQARATKDINRQKKRQALLDRWDDSCAEALELLKKKLISAPALAYPDCSKMLALSTDASILGAGCALPQKDDNGALRAAGCGSRKFSGPERHWGAPEKELLAFAHAARIFRPYLHGAKLLWKADAKALKWMRHTALASKLARWSLSLQELDFTISRMLGKENIIPDAISRQESMLALLVEPSNPYVSANSAVTLLRPDFSAVAAAGNAQDTMLDGSCDAASGQKSIARWWEQVNAVTARSVARESARKNAEGERETSNVAKPKTTHKDTFDTGSRNTDTVGKAGSGFNTELNNDNGRAAPRGEKLINSGDAQELEQNLPDTQSKYDVEMPMMHIPSPTELRISQLADPACGPILMHLERPERAPVSKRKTLRMQSQPCAAHDGLLMRKKHKSFGNPELRACAPDSLTRAMIFACHSHPLSGHFSASKTLCRMLPKCYFPNMLEKMQAYARSCHECAALKHPRRKRSGKMPSMTAAYPLQKAMGDIYGPLPASNGNVCIAALVDVLARWPEAKAMPAKSAKEAAQACMELIVSRHGAPTLFLSDHGSDFDNALLKALCHQLGAEKRFQLHATRTHME